MLSGAELAQKTRNKIGFWFPEITSICSDQYLFSVSLLFHSRLDCKQFVSDTVFLLQLLTRI